MDFLTRFSKWYEERQDRIRSDYFRFLSFPSISADPAYKKDVLACADFLTDYLRQGGLHVEQIPTCGYPIVYAEDCSAGKEAPTILLYGHYDVQPVDPLELWTSPPFEPTERDGKVFARGAVDDKGQIFYACLAVLAWKSLNLPLPVNVKFCIEGEEESHSMGLSKSLSSLKAKLAADVALIVDFDAMPDGTPVISLGARGCMAFDVTIHGSLQDLHSGLMGGIAYNPNRALAEILAKLWDENGRVAVPGFYEGVQNPSQDEQHAVHFGMTEDSLKRDFAIEALGKEKHRTLKEANWFFPTIEINGMFGGYTGSGTKTVIPAHATAKLSCRLVPGQDAARIFANIRAFIEKQAPLGMRVEFQDHGGLGAYKSDSNIPLVAALGKAASEVAGKKAVLALSGASIPIGAEFARELKLPVIGMGVGLATDAIHSPNEHFDLHRFKQGFLTVARMIEWFRQKT
jgi:acetylornithine deacetylase/succinyl-diaminopimelate desuccinylase-like protein